MSELVQFDLVRGGTVLVRVDENFVGAEPGPLVRGGLRDRADLPQRAARTFDESVRAIQPAAEVLLQTMSGLSNSPDEIQVEFAIELSAQAGACIATLGSTANFRVSLTWRPAKGQTTERRFETTLGSN
jgi:hypothetical protein